MNNILEKEFIDLNEKLGFYFGRLISRPLVPPEHVYLSLTTRCNLRCQMCDITRNPSTIEDELSTSKIKDIILQIKDMGIKHLIFSGGEPFLRKDFFEIAEFAQASDIERIDIITNGIFFDEYTIQKLANLRLNHISISLDGLKETNDRIRGEGVFRLVENNIDRFIHYRQKKGFSFPTLGINFTIMDNNIDDILPMIEFARAKGLNAIFFQPVLFNNIRMYEKKTNALWPKEGNILKLKEIIKKIVYLKNGPKDFVICTDVAMLGALPGYFGGKRAKNNLGCYEAIKRIAITCDGKLWSCMGTYGDLKKDDLKKLWLSRDATGVRKKAKRCREHCLQDCVYFRPDILSHARRLLKRLGGKNEPEDEDIGGKLLKRVNHYIDILKETYVHRRFPAKIRLKAELMKLYLARENLRRMKKGIF